jgi:hypothetical protein
MNVGLLENIFHYMFSSETKRRALTCSNPRVFMMLSQLMGFPVLLLTLTVLLRRTFLTVSRQLTVLLIPL